MLNFVLCLFWYFLVSILTKILQFYPSWFFLPSYWQHLAVLSKRTFDTQSIHIFGLVYYLSTSRNNPFYIRSYTYSWLSLSRTRLTQISGWVNFLSKSRTSLCINIYNLTPVESNSDESKFRLSKHVYYLGLKIGSQLKHPVIDFDIFTYLFHNLSN